MDHGLGKAFEWFQAVFPVSKDTQEFFEPGKRVCIFPGPLVKTFFKVIYPVPGRWAAFVKLFHGKLGAAFADGLCRREAHVASSFLHSWFPEGAGRGVSARTSCTDTFPGLHVFTGEGASQDKLPPFFPKV
jgi:hypothetical protein